MESPVDLCCIGHITKDKVTTPAGTAYLPGGTAFYFSSAVAQLDVSYLLVTAVATPELAAVDALRQMGIAVKLFPSPHTVFFENSYGHNPDERTQKVLQQATPFAPAQLALLEACIFHLGPLLPGDIAAESIATLARKGKVSIDVQGYLRRVEDGLVKPADWPAKKAVLCQAFFVKANEEELQVLTGCSTVEQGAKTLIGWGVKEAIITLGSKGSVVYDGDCFYPVPSFVPQQVKDATGCGDTYMAGYLYKRSKGAGITEAGTFAAAMATLKLEQSGPFTGTRQEVERLLEKSRLGDR